MAVLVGSQIGADHIFSFGGQWNLEGSLKREFAKKQFYTKEQQKYVDISNHCNLENVIWFYTYYAESDQINCKYAIKNPAIKVMAMNTRQHGDLIFPECMGRLLTMQEEELVHLTNKYNGKIINKRKFCLEFMKFKEALPIWKKDVVHHHKSLQLIGKVMERDIIGDAANKK